MKPEEVRTALTVLELTLKQWKAGTLTKLEGGEPIAAEHVAAWRREIEELKAASIGCCSVRAEGRATNREPSQEISRKCH